MTCGIVWYGLLPWFTWSSYPFQIISHLEFEDKTLPEDRNRFNSLISAFAMMNNMEALSLPSTLDVTVNEDMTTLLNRVLRKLDRLHRLDFPYCNLKGHLGDLLNGLDFGITYLNIKDCRLAEDDLYFLVNWKPVAALLELNLSHNNLKHLEDVVYLLLEKMSHITCFSISYCSLDVDSQIQVAQKCKECSRLKVLCMQSFTPLPKDRLHDILYFCTQNLSLQKCVILPECYAFIGNNDEARWLNKLRIIKFCYTYLQSKLRPDIMLTWKRISKEILITTSHDCYGQAFWCGTYISLTHLKRHDGFKSKDRFWSLHSVYLHLTTMGRPRSDNQNC